MWEIFEESRYEWPKPPQVKSVSLSGSSCDGGLFVPTQAPIVPTESEFVPTQAAIVPTGS
jgi:hypothetical protein